MLMTIDREELQLKLQEWRQAEKVAEGIIDRLRKQGKLNAEDEAYLGQQRIRLIYYRGGIAALESIVTSK